MGLDASAPTPARPYRNWPQRCSGRAAEPMAAVECLSQEAEHGAGERIPGTPLKVHKPVFAVHGLHTAVVRGLHPSRKHLPVHTSCPASNRSCSPLLRSRRGRGAMDVRILHRRMRKGDD